jgi:hypothetical protein
MEFSSDNIKNALKQYNNSFEIFKMNYTDTEKKVINDFILNGNYQYDHYGMIKDMKDLKSFLYKVGQNKKKNIKKLTQIIKKMINTVINGYGVKYFWISIRITMPNNLYDIPRWHQDGKFFNKQYLQSKFVTVLKGDGTLFMKSDAKSLHIYSDILSKKQKQIKDENITTFKEQIKLDDDIYRPMIADEYSTCEECEVVQLNNDEGAIFYVGDIQKAAIHSEPKMTHPRIFISILPGEKEDIEARAQRVTQRVVTPTASTQRVTASTQRVTASINRFVKKTNPSSPLIMSMSGGFKSAINKNREASENAQHESFKFINMYEKYKSKYINLKNNMNMDTM